MWPLFRAKPAIHCTPTKFLRTTAFYLEIDTMPGQHPLDVIQEVEGVLARARSNDPDLNVDLNFVQATHGAEISKDEYLVKALSRAHWEVFNTKAQTAFDAWFCDTTALTLHGNPSLCYHTAGRSQFGGKVITQRRENTATWMIFLEVQEFSST